MGLAFIKTRRIDIVIKKPYVSIILPVFNCEDYITDSIQSILDQTFTNFELLIIDDGSTDNTYKKIKQIKDSRIILTKQKNKGLPKTLNESFKRAKGKYIARQDADDFSYPTRLEKQVKFLEANPNFGIVGTWAEIWVDQKKSDRALLHSCENYKLKFDILFDSGFVHSSVMIRKEIFNQLGGYNSKFQPVEDYEYWTRVLEKFNGANIPEQLQIYRELSSSMIRANPEKNLSKIIIISSEAISRITDHKYKKIDIHNLVCLSHRAYNFIDSKPNMSNIRKILLKISKKISNSTKEESEMLEKHILKKLNLIEISFFYYQIRNRPRIIRVVDFAVNLLKFFLLTLARVKYEKK